MDDNDTELSSALSKKDINPVKMPGTKCNLGQKRRRSVTPAMRPVAIAPKTNFRRGIQNVELAIKNEPGFIAIVPRTNQILSENDQGNKAIGKIEQYEIFEPLTAGQLQNGKRIKLGTDETSMQYIILQNPNLENCNTILIADNEEKISNQPKTNSHEYTIMKNNILSNNGTLQQYNVADRSNLANCSTFSVSQKLQNFIHQEQISMTVTNSEKIHYNLHKNNALEPERHSSVLSKCNTINNESKPVILRNTTINNMIEKPESLNVTSMESLESSDPLKSRSQKPVVIMQQQLSPPNRTVTSSVKTKQTPLCSLGKLQPLDIQGVNIETKVLLEHASPPKTNENFYSHKTMGNIVATRANNDEQETDFLLKKEFPVISSSQVDSVLKAIDMQSLNRAIVQNEVMNNSKKETGSKDAHDIERSLPGIQDAAKLCAIDNAQCAENVTDSPTRLETNRITKRFQSDMQADNYSKAVERLVDTLQCYKCKECSYMSLNEKYIFKHIEREHMGVSGSKEKPILKCPGCANTFHYEASLLSHIVHDHQVHESEAQLMVQQLFYKQSLNPDNETLKPVSQIRIPKTQNEQIFITQASSPLLENDQKTQILSAPSPPKITSVNPMQASLQHSEINNGIVENETLQYVQNVHNMPVIVESNLGAVDVRNASFINEDRTFATKSDVQQNPQITNCSEKLNLFELKSAGERNFEFVNIKTVNHNDDEGYLQEDDPIERVDSDSDTEFVDPAAPGRAVKVKKKGRPKGSKSHSAKVKPVVLKQGYKCEMEDCGVRMLVQENISYHQKCHVVTTTPHTVSFQCPECVEFKCNTWNNLAGHLWRSHIIDMELHSCDLCSYKTPSLSNLANQHRGIHGSDRPFLCDNCGKGFKTTKQLRNHRALHNAKAKEPLKCDECRRDFTNTRLLKLHKESVHKESKPFTCSSCTYSAATRSALKLHLRRHTGEKPFSCEQCSYSTGDHNSLRRHKLRHLGLKPYSCPYCSYACIQSSTYKVHLKNKHPGLDHDLMFSCQYCSYKSIKKDNLLTHMAKHEQALSNKSLASSESPILVE